MTQGTLREADVSEDVLDALGIDPDDLDWRQLAVCKGQDTWRWYEGYESNARVANLTDEICGSCSVRKACLQSGIENDEHGCWGGVYLTAGRIDDSKNTHKAPGWKEEIWELLSEDTDA